MADSLLTSPESIKIGTEPLAGIPPKPAQQLISESATPLQGQKKGFPVMPSPKNMLGMPIPSSGLNARERGRPSSGPPIDDREAVLLGRKLVPEDYAEEQRANMALGLRSSVQQSQGALGHLPPEIVVLIEEILQDEMDRTTFTRSDLPERTRYHPCGMNMDRRIGRLNLWLEENKTVVTRAWYG